jgi:hypothetical protein
MVEPPLGAECAVVSGVRAAAATGPAAAAHHLQSHGPPPSRRARPAGVSGQCSAGLLALASSGHPHPSVAGRSTCRSSGLPQCGMPAATVRSGHPRQTASRSPHSPEVRSTPIPRIRAAALLAAARDRTAKAGLPNPPDEQPKHRDMSGTIGRGGDVGAGKPGGRRRPPAPPRRLCPAASRGSVLPPAPSHPYPGERVRVRGRASVGARARRSGVVGSALRTASAHGIGRTVRGANPTGHSSRDRGLFDARPLTPTLSPGYGGEGAGGGAAVDGRAAPATVARPPAA